MKNSFRSIYSLSVIAAASAILYFVIRIFAFLNNLDSWTDIVVSGLLLFGELYMITHALGFSINLFRLKKRKRLFRFKKIERKEEWPSVGVVLSAKHEPKNLLEQTIITLKSLDYPNFEIFFLDGSVNPNFLEQDRNLALNYGINYFHYQGTEDSKAVTVNKFLDIVKTKYLVFFDADQNPLPSFLKEVVGIAETSGNIAFVQTPQLYSNIEVSPIAKGSALQQSIFYESICESKGSVNAMFCCGTNVLFRREALLKVGGFDETSVTEDFATSLKLHLGGYRSVYYNHVRAFGTAPENLPAYFKQQARWANGTTALFRKLIKNFFKNPFQLSLSQWWEYTLSSTYYFVGWAFLLLMLGPILYLLAGVPSYFVKPQFYIGFFVPYYIMTFTVFYATMKKRHYGFGNVYHGIILGSLSFPVLVGSTLKGILGVKTPFITTPKGEVNRLSIPALLPWIIMIALNALAIIVGMFKFSAQPYAIGINIFWCLYHTFLLSHVFYFNKLPELNPLILNYENTQRSSR